MYYDNFVRTFNTVLWICYGYDKESSEKCVETKMLPNVYQNKTIIFQMDTPNNSTHVGHNNGIGWFYLS